MVGPPDDDQHVPVAEARPGLRQVDRTREQTALLPQVGHRVLGEVVERPVDPAALLLETHRQLLGLEHPALHHQFTARPDSAALHLDLVPVRDPLEQLGTRVDQPDAGSHQRQGPGVRIGAVGRGCRIERGADAAGGQLLGGDPVEVAMVDHGQVAGSKPLDQLLGAPAEPGGAADRGERWRAPIARDYFQSAP